MIKSGWLSTGRAPTSPIVTPSGLATAANGRLWPRRKVNSPLTLGREEPPSPVFFGSPVWAMKSSITRKKLSPS